MPRDHTEDDCGCTGGDRSAAQKRGSKGRKAISRRTFLGGAVAAASIAATPALRTAAADTAGSADPVLDGPDGLRVEARPYGGSLQDVAALRDELEATVLREQLSGARFRWLSFKRDAVRRQVDIPREPRAFSAAIYDYTNGGTLDLAGRVDRLGETQVLRSGRQPLPSHEEFDEAVAFLFDDPNWGPGLKAGHLHAYPPMPPLLDSVDGHRVVAVGLHASDPAADEPAHRMVGVDLEDHEVVIDQALHVSAEDCVAPPFAHDCPDTGHTGQAQITVTKDGVELWRLIVVRPAESSGTNGSGAELRHVHYRGRSVLHRAHVPILNVEYGTDYVGPNLARCGPTYRDWLDQESCFEAVGTDVSSGVRLCADEPRTIMTSAKDAGNFHGAAVYLDGSDLVITSELSAGWYRYITEWKLHDDGNITPRFGFSAIRNPCTCRHHVHHAYWRFDVAVDGLNDHRVEEHNDTPTLTAPAGWRTLDREASRDRDSEQRRHWRMTNRTTGTGLRLEPGWDDARADLYGAGDTWFLRHHPDEIDDGQGFTVNPVESRARIDLFADGEDLDGRDVVAWYAGHWNHEHGDDGDWVSPSLRRIDP